MSRPVVGRIVPIVDAPDHRDVISSAEWSPAQVPAAAPVTVPVITGMVPAGAAAGVLETERHARAELAALRDLLSAPAGLLLTEQWDGVSACVAFGDSCAAYDAVIAIAGAVENGDPLDPWGTTVVATVGRVRFIAGWAAPCTVTSHAHVADHPEAYRREVDIERGRCRRCSAYVAPSFAPEGVL